MFLCVMLCLLVCRLRIFLEVYFDILLRWSFLCPLVRLCGLVSLRRRFVLLSRFDWGRLFLIF